MLSKVEEDSFSTFQFLRIKLNGIETMKYSGIGGQAVMEGVMMRNGENYAVAVRKPDGDIAVVNKKYEGVFNSDVWGKIPFVRGVVSFINSLVMGISTLLLSASFYEDEEEGAEPVNKEHAQVRKEEVELSKKDKTLMGITTAISFVIALAIFVVLPYFLSQFLNRVIPERRIIVVLEGLLRLAIFIVYIALISRTKEIHRVFMYHGAEHKRINCIEHGLDLTVENVRASSKEHKRCGTSFIVFVVIISVVVFIFIPPMSHAMRIAVRLLLVPVIAGISFEILRLAGRSDNPVINILSKPGLAMQHLTTQEPDDSMIEVGIASVEAVFDWHSFVEEVRQTGVTEA